MEVPKIQLCGAPCGQHGPYTFYKSFKFTSKSRVVNLSLGEFFYVRVLKDAPLCIGELQLLWLDKNHADYKLCSVRLYFVPEDTPEGRLSHHGKDEILAEGEKVVLELHHLLEWIVEDKVEWVHGSKAFPNAQTNTSTNYSSLVKMFAANNCGLKFQEKTPEQADSEEPPEEPRNNFNADVVILSYPQYCRYRCILRRLESCPNQWLKNAVISAIGGFTVQNPRARVMFCRNTMDHPLLEDHSFRLDHLVPLLKGRRRKKLSFKKDSCSESGDSESDRLVINLNDAEEKPSVIKELKVDLGRSLVPSDGQLSHSNGAPNKKTHKILRPADHKPSTDDEKEFLHNLFSFMRKFHRPIERLPTLGFKEVDLYLFFTYAQKFGGYEKVTQNRQWKQIYDILGGNPTNTSAATCTRRVYEKLLLPYERYLRGEHSKPLPAPYQKPAYRQLISNIANNGIADGSPPEDLKIGKMDEKLKEKKIPKTVQEMLHPQRKSNKTVQEILKSQRSFSPAMDSLHKSGYEGSGSSPDSKSDLTAMKSNPKSVPHFPFMTPPSPYLMPFSGEAHTKGSMTKLQSDSSMGGATTQPGSTLFSRPSVIHPLPHSIDANSSKRSPQDGDRKRAFPFADESDGHSKLFKKVPSSSPPAAHCSTSSPSKGTPAPPIKTSDYIDQLRQVQRQKHDQDENCAPLDLSLKTKPAANGFPHSSKHSSADFFPCRIKPEEHVEEWRGASHVEVSKPGKSSQHSAFKAVDSTPQKSSSLPVSSVAPPLGSFPLPIVHPAFAHFAGTGVMPPAGMLPTQFNPQFLYPSTSEGAMAQVAPQLMYQQMQAAGTFLIPSIRLYPPSALRPPAPPQSSSTKQ